MRISVLANAPWGVTAYSNMARLFGPRLQRLGHDVSMTALWGLQGGIVDWGGIPVYPKAADKFNRDVMGAHAKHWQADVFMSWCDAFVVDPKRILDLPWSPWFPIDAEPMSPHLPDLLRQARWPLVYSRFGLRMARDVGLEHVRYVPVGVDTDVFTVRDKAKARKAVGLPQDRFIVGMVQANINGDRKAIPQQMRAFAEFRRHYPDALLYVHAYRWDHLQGVDMPVLCESLGLEAGKDVILAHTHSYVSGLYGDESMANLYNAFDVLLAVTRGEGFGVPIVEAAACGTPAIIGDWSSMSELNFAGMAHPEHEAIRVWNNFVTWWWLPRPAVIASLLAEAHGRTFDPWALRQCALAYDADAIVQDYWLPLLAEMEAEL